MTMNLPFVRTEPVLLAAAVRALFVAAVAFGANLSGEQIAAVVAAIEIVGALFVRPQVTPEGNVVVVETAEEAFELLTEDPDLPLGPPGA